MATQFLLCVEPDEAVLEVIRTAVSPYGFEVHNITNAEEAVSWARQMNPAVAIVSIEPGKVGYNICNKFKRTNELKDIPLLLISGQETQQQLEQHRKLKVRANEYLTKPFTVDDLREKIGLIYNLADAGASSDIMVSTDGLEEIAIDGGDLGDEDILEVDEVDIEDSFDDAATRAVASGDLEAALDLETEAAFAALQSPEEGVAPATSMTPMRVTADSPFEDQGGEQWDVSTAAAALEHLEMPQTPARSEGSGLNASELFDDGATRAVPNAADLGIFAGLSAGSVLGDPQAPTVDEDPTGSLELGEPTSVGNAEAPFGLSEVVPEALEVSASDTFEAPAIADEIPRAWEPSAPVAAMPREASVAEVASLRSELDAVKQQAETLRFENDALKTGMNSSASERNKLLFELKEQLRQEKKERLTLTEDAAKRDEQELQRKQQMLSLQRENQSIEEKAFGLEKNLAATTEKLDAVSIDKDRAVERERGLRSKLDDAQHEIAKAHDDLNALKARSTAAEEKLRSDLDRLRGEMESKLEETAARAHVEHERLAEEHATADAAAEQAHQAEIGQLRESHANEIQAAFMRFAADKAAIESANQSGAEKARRETEQALASLKEEQRGQLETEREAQRAAGETRERDHKNEIQGIRKRHEDELAAADDRRQRELGDAEKQRASELEYAEERRRTDLKQRDEEHLAKMSDLDRKSFQEKTETAERHRGELDSALSRAAKAEGELAARLEELSGTQRRLSGVESDLDATRTDLRDRQNKLNQAQSRIAELEHKTLGYEEQIMRTFNRMRADEKIVTKAKRAMAVALSLLEERGLEPGSSDSQDPGGVPAAPASKGDTDENAGAR